MVDVAQKLVDSTNKKENRFTITSPLSKLFADKEGIDSAGISIPRNSFSVDPDSQDASNLSEMIQTLSPMAREQQKPTVPVRRRTEFAEKSSLPSVPIKARKTDGFLDKKTSNSIDNNDHYYRIQDRQQSHSNENSNGSSMSKSMKALLEVGGSGQKNKSSSTVTKNGHKQSPLMPLRHMSESPLLPSTLKKKEEEKHAHERVRSKSFFPSSISSMMPHHTKGINVDVKKKLEISSPVMVGPIFDSDLRDHGKQDSRKQIKNFRSPINDHDQDNVTTENETDAQLAEEDGHDNNDSKRESLKHKLKRASKYAHSHYKRTSEGSQSPELTNMSPRIMATNIPQKEYEREADAGNEGCDVDSLDDIMSVSESFNFVHLSLNTFGESDFAKETTSALESLWNVVAKDTSNCNKIPEAIAEKRKYGCLEEFNAMAPVPNHYLPSDHCQTEPLLVLKASFSADEAGKEITEPSHDPLAANSRLSRGINLGYIPEHRILKSLVGKSEGQKQSVLHGDPTIVDTDERSSEELLSSKLAVNAQQKRAHNSLDPPRKCSNSSSYYDQYSVAEDFQTSNERAGWTYDPSEDRFGLYSSPYRRRSSGRSTKSGQTDMLEFWGPTRQNSMASQWTFSPTQTRHASISESNAEQLGRSNSIGNSQRFNDEFSNIFKSIPEEGVHPERQESFALTREIEPLIVRRASRYEQTDDTGAGSSIGSMSPMSKRSDGARTSLATATSSPDEATYTAVKPLAPLHLSSGGLKELH